MKVFCPACSGKGKRELSPSLARTLHLIHTLGKPTCPEIFVALGEPVKRCAINRRVARLVEFKVVRQEPGTKRNHRYSAVNGG